MTVAKANRHNRAKARVKRDRSLLKRQLRAVTSEYVKTHMTLVTVLAQLGGEKVVTIGTMAQVQANLTNLSWAIAPAEGQPEQGAKEFVVRVVTRDETPQDGLEEDDEIVQSRYVEPEGDVTNVLDADLEADATNEGLPEVSE